MALTPEEESELENIKVAIEKAAATYTDLAIAHVAMPGLNAVARIMTTAMYHSSPMMHSFDLVVGGRMSEMLRQAFAEVFLAGMEYGKAGQTLTKIPGECDDPHCPGNHARRN